MLLNRTFTATICLGMLSAALVAAPSVSHAGGYYNPKPCHNYTPPPPPKPNCDRGQKHNNPPVYDNGDDDDYNGGWQSYCKRFFNCFKFKKHY